MVYPCSFTTHQSPQPIHERKFNMASLDEQESLINGVLLSFLARNPLIRATVRRYDASVSDAFANDPHIDWQMHYRYRQSMHAGRPFTTENDRPRLAQLSIDELHTITSFVKDFATTYPKLSIVLPRIDSGRCAFVIRLMSDDSVA